MKALLANTFHVNKPIIGMIHLSGYTPEQAKEWAKKYTIDILTAALYNS